eukprot:TRINITY_DN1548_c0_g1_i2.p1 TRINITY_DN1548_c0_g1~~TRINITY_DN1548_c0_g1_i2.p1  ORF type:complete len:619 (-),score=107.50 TRINITY_DN1548_c0_g1_i2:889-2745(-)
MWKETNEQFEEHKTQTDSKNFQADPVMSIPRITDLDEGKEEGIFSKGKANRILNKFRSLSTSQEKGSVSPPSERSKSPERSSPTEPKVPFWKTNRSKSNQSLEEDKSDQLAEATRVKAVADSNRLLKFQRLLEEEIVDLSALRKLSWKGIPPSVRSITWKLLMGYLPVNKDRRQAAMERKQKEYIECIPKYFEVDESERTVDYKQIQMDVPRTNPHVLLFQNGVVQQCLARILYIWAVRHPASGYVQGINDLATPFFVVFLSAHLQMEMDEVCALPDLDEIATSDLRLIEADTYWCLTKLLDGIQDNYTFSQPGIQRMIHKLSELVHRIEVPLYEHLRQQQVGMNRGDRALGILLGLAAGDRNGGPIRMVCRLGESLVAHNGYDRKDVIERYSNWFIGPPKDEEKAFDTGAIFKRVFLLHEQGLDIDDAANQVFELTQSAGVNAAHRIAPISVFAKIAESDLTNIVTQETKITHHHALSIETAIITAQILRALRDGASWKHALSWGSQFSTSEETKEAFQTSDPPTDAGGFAPNVLKAALYFISNTQSFKDALYKSLQFAGEDNYCPVLVGALAGGLYGAEEIPEVDLQHEVIEGKFRTRLLNVCRLLTQDLRITDRS